MTHVCDEFNPPRLRVHKDLLPVISETSNNKKTCSIMKNAIRVTFSLTPLWPHVKLIPLVTTIHFL